MIKYNLNVLIIMSLRAGFLILMNLINLNKKLLECIYCSSKKISKSLMSPMISVAKEKKIEFEKLNRYLREEKNQLIKMRNYIEKNFEYVGENFSKKVREIYYDKKSKKVIYGRTTLDERKELEEEGINLLTIPWLDKEN